MADQPSLSVHRVHRGMDLGSMVRLVNVCFNQKVDEAYFDWKYFQNPAGEVIGFVAMAEGNVVSFYGVIPEWYWVNGSKSLIFQSMDTMTDPAFRRIGLFEKLARKTYDAVRETQPSFTIIGFPSAQSFPGFIRKLHWVNAFNWKYFFCYRIAFWFMASRGAIKSVAIQELLEVTTDLAGFLNERKPDHSIQKYFDREVIAWKVFGNRHKRVRLAELRKQDVLVGYFAYVVDTPKSCCLLHIDVFPAEDQPSLIKEIVDYLFRKTGTRCVYAWDPLGVEKRKALKRLGFLVNPFGRGPFHHQFPFILLQEAPADSAVNWMNPDSYCFEGIMLD